MNGRPPERYIVTLPGAVGAHREPETVTVYRISGTGPDGGPVYADADGAILVEITSGAAGLLAARGRPGLPPVLHAQPLP